MPKSWTCFPIYPVVPSFLRRRIKGSKVPFSPLINHPFVLHRAQKLFANYEFIIELRNEKNVSRKREAGRDKNETVDFLSLTDWHVDSKENDKDAMAEHCALHGKRDESSSWSMEVAAPFIYLTLSSSAGSSVSSLLAHSMPETEDRPFIKHRLIVISAGFRESNDGPRNRRCFRSERTEGCLVTGPALSLVSTERTFDSHTLLHRKTNYHRYLNGAAISPRRRSILFHETCPMGQSNHRDWGRS